MIPREPCCAFQDLAMPNSGDGSVYILNVFIVLTSKEPVCPRVELIFKIIIILLIIFLGFIKSKPC